MTARYASKLWGYLILINSNPLVYWQCGDLKARDLKLLRATKIIESMKAYSDDLLKYGAIIKSIIYSYFPLNCIQPVTIYLLPFVTIPPE